MGFRNNLCSIKLNLISCFTGKANSIAEAHMMDVDKIKMKLEELNQKLTDVCGDISEDLHHWADYQVRHT